MIHEAIKILARKEDLHSEQALAVMDQIMRGKASDIQIASYLTALSIKGETIDEITASAAAMRKHCVKLLNDQEALEIVGTGGDGSNSFNISTAAALVVSAVGVPVAKHGNRSATSKCGSADVLEALGVNIQISPEKSAELLDKIGMCFMFAQNYHLAMKYVAPIRRELNIRTVFNILGPLTNPAGATMQLLGVYEEELVEPIAKVLCNLGVKNAMVVYGRDKLDEISICAETFVCEVKNGWVKSSVITPESLGFARAQPQDLQGGNATHNAHIIRDILSGAQGPKTDAVILNAAAALYVAKSLPLTEAIEHIRNIIASGKALEQLQNFVRLSNEV